MSNYNTTNLPYRSFNNGIALAPDFTQQDELLFDYDSAIAKEVFNACNLIDATKESIPHEVILENLLPYISEIDFREHARLEEDQKLKHKHYYVISIENILAIAKQQNWGICKCNSSIYLYNGAFWQLTEEGSLKDFLGRAAENMGVDEFDAKYHLFKEQLFKQFLSAARLPKLARSKGTVLINLQNGTFEISPNRIRLRDFDRNDFITYQLPFSYDENAVAPLFKAYLNQVLPNEEKQQIIAEYLGSVFIDQNILKLEKALLLYGTGANGKSVLFDIINALLGHENVTSYSLQSLTDINGYSRAKLENKLLNYASELSTRLDTNIFKQLTSGEPIEVRLPYGEPYNLYSYAKLLFNCNELPKDIEHTDAFFRRLIIIEFSITIPEEEQDKQLAQKIIASELSGVFNWLLDGLSRLLKQKRFSNCQDSDLQIKQYRKQSDSVQMFLDENSYVPSTDKCITQKELYQSYRSFCLDDGYKPVNNTNFRKRLDNVGYLTIRRNIGHVVFAEVQAQIL